MKLPYYTIISKSQKNVPMHFDGIFKTEEEALKHFKGPSGAVEQWLVKVIDYRDIVKEFHENTGGKYEKTNNRD